MIVDSEPPEVQFPAPEQVSLLHSVLPPTVVEGMYCDSMGCHVLPPTPLEIPTNVRTKKIVELSSTLRMQLNAWGMWVAEKKKIGVEGKKGQARKVDWMGEGAEKWHFKSLCLYALDEAGNLKKCEELLQAVQRKTLCSVMYARACARACVSSTHVFVVTALLSVRIKNTMLQGCMLPHFYCRNHHPWAQ